MRDDTYEIWRVLSGQLGANNAGESDSEGALERVRFRIEERWS